METKKWFDKGVALCRLGKYEKAIFFFDKAIELNPDEANFYDHKGMALGCLGRNEEAVQFLIKQ